MWQWHTEKEKFNELSLDAGHVEIIYLLIHSIVKTSVC